MGEEGEQPTEEQVTAAVTGAQTLLLPAENPGTPSVIASSSALTPAPPASTSTNSAVQIPHKVLAVSSSANVSPSNGQGSSMSDSLIPGKEDEGSSLQIETELREHDVRMVPELIGEEAASARATLGKSCMTCY